MRVSNLPKVMWLGGGKEPGSGVCVLSCHAALLLLTLLLIAILFISAWPDNSGEPGTCPENNLIPLDRCNVTSNTLQFALQASFLNFYQSKFDYNVVLVSDVEQRESVTHIHISTHFQIIFPYRSLQSIEQGSLCYTVGPYYLFYIQVKAAQSCLTLCDPMDYSLPGFSVHGILQARYWSGQPFLSPRDLPNPGIKPRSPALQAYSLPSEPPEKPRNTRRGSLSLLQGICLTQESNQDFLHCSWILYQLSYNRSSVYMLIPISQFIPPSSFLSSNHKFVFSICDSILIFVNKFICAIFFFQIIHVSGIICYLSFCV